MMISTGRQKETQLVENLNVTNSSKMYQLKMHLKLICWLNPAQLTGPVTSRLLKMRVLVTQAEPSLLLVLSKVATPCDTGQRKDSLSNKLSIATPVVMAAGVDMLQTLWDISITMA